MTTMTPEQATWFAQTFDRLVGNVGQAVLGKAHVVRLTLTCMLSEGHILLEDAPGTGKTSLARASLRASRARTTASSSPRTSCRPTSRA